MKRYKIIFLLALLTIIGTIFRFYNLSWGSPFYFHPDERNIASSVSQLSFPNQMNPNFFAYGSFPIYIIYFLGLIINIITGCKLHVILACPESSSTIVKFEQAIIISRMISTMLSISLIPLLYLIGKSLKNNTTGLLAAAFSTFSVGLIQFAHFGTFEIWTTFLSVLIFYLCLKLLEKPGAKKIVLTGVITGLALATKVSNSPLLFIPLLTLTIYYRYTNISIIKKGIPRMIFLLVVSFLIFFITSPFIFSDFSSFLSSMNYESEVALGNLPVFYTGEFVNTIPVIFQFLRIYPFILNPLLTILFIPSLICLVYNSLKRKDLRFYILNTIYLIIFLPNAFLFAKWTRYIIPTLPFMYLIISIFLADAWCHTELVSVSRKIKIQKRKSYFIKFITFIILIFAIIFTTSYFITAFVKSDTRAEAALWAKNNLNSNANVLSEAYDLGIVPFNQYFSNIKLFNFYDLDSASTSDGGRLSLRSHDSSEVERLETILSQSDYIILPSQRIMKTRLINANKFPTGYIFYSSLFNEKAGFKKIYETPCDIFCKIIYLGNPVFSFEETANVFDRPTVFIFKKIKK